MFLACRLDTEVRLGINGICRPDCERSSDIVCVKRLSRSEPRRAVSDSVNAAPISCCAKWVTENFQLCSLPSYQHTHSDTVCAIETHTHTHTHTHTLRQQCWLLAAVPRSLLLKEIFCNLVFFVEVHFDLCWKSAKGEATANAGVCVCVCVCFLTDIISQNGLGNIFRERKVEKNTHIQINMI